LDCAPSRCPEHEWPTLPGADERKHEEIGRADSSREHHRKQQCTVRTAIATLMRDRTTIVFAHRLSTVRDADRIVALEDGRVAEQGTHDTLLARSGVYAQLVGAQLSRPATPLPTGVPTTGTIGTAVAVPVAGD
jgi:hypothetical protein